MKQFEVHSPHTGRTEVLDEGLALSMVSTATDSLLIQWCPEGRSFVDSDGFSWVRLGDVADVWP